MNEMIDRVTEAIIDVILDAGGTIDFKVQPVARAIIAAMREPTTEMINQGACYHWDDSRELEDAALAWCAMIDAALAETKVPE